MPLDSTFVQISNWKTELVIVPIEISVYNLETLELLDVQILRNVEVKRASQEFFEIHKLLFAVRKWKLDSITLEILSPDYLNGLLDRSRLVRDFIEHLIPLQEDSSLKYLRQSLPNVCRHPDLSSANLSAVARSHLAILETIPTERKLLVRLLTRRADRSR
jgi:hypothetical protein